ncbi:DUF3165 family protein [Streptococcus himalayensis]|uniref:DUF3165 family protein n=1 Tax=Streptococcus himalayensis TaxID=1888195 RepID=A0A917A897_9STRE|nr:DUF3165 family protein [Streptococcus himalayensis]GGE34151.1 hypothetical protein GCM10011510_14410 [Streptococcus himalayensis]
MVYLIIGILILLFYLFATPKSIKGTLNVVSAVVLLVSLMILLVLAIFQIFLLPAEFFISIPMGALAYYAMRDLARLPQKEKKQAFFPKIRKRRP